MLQEKVVQGHYCPRWTLSNKLLSKLPQIDYSYFVYRINMSIDNRMKKIENYVNSFDFVKLMPWTEVSFDNCPTDNHPLDNYCFTELAIISIFMWGEIPLKVIIYSKG